MRHQPPEIVREYYRIIQAGPPKCCHTCDHYDQDGKCGIHEMSPPEDFASAVDACDKWAYEVPF